MSIRRMQIGVGPRISWYHARLGHGVPWLPVAAAGFLGTLRESSGGRPLAISRPVS